MEFVELGGGGRKERRRGEERRGEKRKGEPYGGWQRPPGDGDGGTGRQPWGDIDGQQLRGDREPGVTAVSSDSSEEMGTMGTMGTNGDNGNQWGRMGTNGDNGDQWGPMGTMGTMANGFAAQPKDGGGS